MCGLLLHVVCGCVLFVVRRWLSCVGACCVDCWLVRSVAPYCCGLIVVVRLMFGDGCCVLSGVDVGWLLLAVVDGWLLCVVLC